MTVTPIRPDVIHQGYQHEPDADLIADLEEMLLAARAGELVGIAYVGSYTEFGTVHHAVGVSHRATLGALALLQARMCRDHLENDGA